MLNSALLQQMTEFHAVSGNEEAFANWLAEELKPHADEVTIDPCGNVIARKGTPRVALFAHLDSPGFMVQGVGEDGAARLAKLGHPNTPANTPVLVETEGSLIAGLLVVNGEEILLEFGDPMQTEQLQPGDIAAFAPNFRQHGEVITSRFLDNKLGCWIGQQAFMQAESLIFVAAVNEEHEPHGAGAVAARLAVDVALVLDATYADSAGSPYPIHLSGGPAITLLDNMLHDRRWAKRLQQVALARGIPYQLEIVTDGGSDALPIARAGLPTIFLGVPTRYTHSPHEVAHFTDCRETLSLILAFLAEYAPE